MNPVDIACTKSDSLQPEPLGEEEKIRLLQQEVTVITSRFDELQTSVRSFAAKAAKVGTVRCIH